MRRTKGQLTTWITITPDNVVTILIPHCEMGQGTPTALAMMAAEEMEADWSLVRVQEAPALDDYANGYIVRAAGGNYVPAVLGRGVDYGAYKLAEWFGFQVTGGSTAVRGTGEYGMRVAGAAAKEMLLAAAAQPVGCQRRRVHGEGLARSRTRRRDAAPRSASSRTRRPRSRCRPARRSRTPTRFTIRRTLAAAARHPVEGGRQRELRHRLHHAGHALRGASRSRRSTAASCCRSTPRRPRRCRA